MLNNITAILDQQYQDPETIAPEDFFSLYVREQEAIRLIEKDLIEEVRNNE